MQIQGPINSAAGDEQELAWGFAHLFRPTYAGANMGHPDGVVGYQERRDKGQRRLSYSGTRQFVIPANSLGAVFALQTTDHEMTLSNILKMLGKQ